MIPFLDLKTINLRHREAFHAALDRVLDSGWLVLGKETDHFEREFADYCGSRHAVGVANGLEAMHLVLRAWGIGPGDEVIVPSNTYIATWLAVTFAGATPVPVEPVESTFNIDPARVEAAITSRTRAIIAVHLYGQTARVDRLMAIAESRGIKVMEDSAQSHGARLNGRRAGSLADASAFSFYPGKNLGALGDAGAVTTDDAALADRLRVLRNYGSRIKYQNEIVGHNSRLDELQSAFLLAKLPLLDADNARRTFIAQTYNRAFASIRSLTLPIVDEACESSWHLYVVRHPRRDALAKALADAGVGTMTHYPIPPHLQPAYEALSHLPGAFPIAERIHNEVLSLPIGPTMTDAEVDRVVQAMLACANT